MIQLIATVYESVNLSVGSQPYKQTSQPYKRALTHTNRPLNSTNGPINPTNVPATIQTVLSTLDKFKIKFNRPRAFIIILLNVLSERNWKL